MSIIPETVTPKQLADATGWSERFVRETARSIGACLGTGRGMRLTQADVVRIKMAADGEIDFTPYRRSRRSDQVYFFAHDRFIKIGWSNNWRKRLKTVQTACPLKVEVLAIYRGSIALEAKLHALFRDHRVRADGEWFHDCQAIRDYIAVNKGLCLI